MKLNFSTNKKGKTILVQFFLSLIIVTGMHAVAAAQTPAVQCGTQGNPDCASSHFDVNQYLTTDNQAQAYLKTGNPVANFIIQIINFLVLTIGSLCFVAIVAGGFILLTSRGAEAPITKGKEIITFAIIGLAVSLSAYIITAFVQSLFYEISGK